MANIHPTSIIDPKAKLADDVIIGPWCYIQGNVTIGAGCVLMERISLQGPLTLGERNMIYPNCSFGLSPQDHKYDPLKPGSGTTIGDHNIFRENITIHRATGDKPTTVGNHNMLMVGAHLAHDVVLGNRCTLTNNALIAGHAVIEDQVVMSGHTAVHQFCRIGRLSMISGNESAKEDLPPFCMLYANRRVSELNLIGLRRNGYRDHIENLKKVFNIYFRQRHTHSTALAIIDNACGNDPLCREFVDFLRSPSRRGIVKCNATTLQSKWGTKEAYGENEN